MEGWVTCSDYISEIILNTAGGLKNAASRNIGKQRELIESPDRFRNLLQEMPPGEMPATGGRYSDSDMKTIKSLLNLHRGELREWDGVWELRHGPLPTRAGTPTLWQSQFLPPHPVEVFDGAVSIVLMPASGGGGNTEEHYVRVACVYRLADLFFDYGEQHTAADLYDVYLELRIFAHVRNHTRPRTCQIGFVSKQ